MRWNGGAGRLLWFAIGATAGLFGALRLRRTGTSAGRPPTTKAELYEWAKRLNVKGRSRMNKQELTSAVEAEMADS